jgi:putative membrane protein
MTDDRAEADKFDVTPTAESHFSWVRTRMSLERTLMSWVRTATALIGFGFTIVQFFDRFQEMKGVEPALRPQAPRFLGLALILVGILALAIATLQYHQMVRYLWSGNFKTLAGVHGIYPKKTPVLTVAVALLLIGVYAFGAVFLRLR